MDKVLIPGSPEWANVSGSTLILTGILVNLVTFITYQKIKQWKKNANKKYPPTLPQMPIIGHMHLMRGYEEKPWEGFIKLRDQLGDIFFLQMGVFKIVVISSYDLMKEVLLEKSTSFADRPDYNRYHTIFGGDRENALALCDWSRTQRIRRIVATMITLPRFSTHMFRQLNYCIKLDLKEYLSILGDRVKKSNSNDPQSLGKPELLFFLGNVFTNYLCSKRFEYFHEGFNKTCWGYDYIFWDINQSFHFDYLPWLTKLGIGSKYLKELSDVCTNVRDYMDQVVIHPRLKQYMKNHNLKLEEVENAKEAKFVPIRNIEDMECEIDARKIRDELRDLRGKDFLDVSLEHHFKEPEVYPWHVALYEALDLIGGSSAVGNLMYRLLGQLALHPEYQEMIHKEALIAIEKNKIRESDHDYVPDKVEEDVGYDHDVDGVPIMNLIHRPDMPFLNCAIQETLRLASSPVVPHVACRDATLGGYDIDDKTMVVFNGFYQNFSEDNWINPHDFDPRRFLIPADVEETHDKRINQLNTGSLYLSKEDDKGVHWIVRRPRHFLPFGVGRRACLGYKLAKTNTFSTVANLVLRYKLSPRSLEEEKVMQEQMKPAKGLGLPYDDSCFQIRLTPRV